MACLRADATLVPDHGLLACFMVIILNIIAGLYDRLFFVFRLPDGYPCQHFHRDLTEVYLSSLGRNEKVKHAFLPFLDFVVHLCAGSRSACRALLGTRFLDMLLYMFARDFSILPWNAGTTDSEIRRSAVLDLCHVALATIISHNGTFRMVYDHPVCAIWPTAYLPDKLITLNSSARFTKRRLAWNDQPLSVLEDRLKTIPLVYPTDGRSFSDLEDAYADLLYFSR